MPDRRDFLTSLALIGVTASAFDSVPAQETAITAQLSGSDDRRYWLDVLRRVAVPVLGNLAARKLKEKMPVEAVAGSEKERRAVTHLEAFGRTLSGIAAWLELDADLAPDEKKFQDEIRTLARQSLVSATDPQSPDFLNFTDGRQPVVDAAFLALGIVRAPNELWKKLDQQTQVNVVRTLKSTRKIQPFFNNWLLFSAMIEAALAVVGEEWDRMRVDYAVRQHEQWYKGDGIYGDGANFHWDYYNSFVIHPLLIEILSVVGKNSSGYEEISKNVLIRAARYAAIQERLIAPDGTYPPIGRSIAYRFGAFHLLGQTALRRALPKEIMPAQVRSALTAVIRRTIEAPETFDKNGWLTIGLCGHQPSLAENYISTGSLYFCANGLLPLGLAPTDEFWSAPPADWTAKKIWSGQDMKADHAI